MSLWNQAGGGPKKFGNHGFRRIVYEDMSLERVQRSDLINTMVNVLVPQKQTFLE
jgi:hypothetical protein